MGTRPARSTGDRGRGVQYAYQWLRDGQPIAHATATTYRLVAADRNARIADRVTGRKEGYLTAARTSARTMPVS